MGDLHATRGFGHGRFTAHGFLAWGVATLFTAALLTSTLSSIISGGVQAGASLAGGAASAVSEVAKPNGDGGPMGYFVDSLFRSQKPAARNASGASPEASSAEVTRIFINAAAAGKLPEQDARYVGQVVAQRTGISQQDAEKRVNESFNQLQARKKEAETAAKEAADKARKASAMAALWLFISLLIGAFVAAFAATYGGRRRDE